MFAPSSTASIRSGPFDRPAPFAFGPEISGAKASALVLIPARNEAATVGPVVRSIVSLAKDLGVGVLAEGVETERQLEVVRALGCEQAQGYLFTQPAPAREARALLTKMWGRRPLPTPGCGAATGAR